MLGITTNFDISARLTPQRSILLKEKKNDTKPGRTRPNLWQEKITNTLQLS